MHVKISNILEVTDYTSKVVEYCKNVLTLPNPIYIKKKQMGLYYQNVDKTIQLYKKEGDKLILPFGCWRSLYLLQKYSSEKNIHEKIGSNIKGKIILYPYQEVACKKLIAGHNGVLVAPCGSGKTQIGLELIHRLKGRTLWLTHTKVLLKQSKKRCETYFTGDFGTITDGKVNIGRDITFATVQTLSSLEKEIYEDKFDVVVIDEVHRVCGSPTNMKMFYKVINNINAEHKYGLTATPNRADGLIDSMFSLIGEKIYEIPESAVGDKRIRAVHKVVLVNVFYDMREYLSADGKTDFPKIIKLLCENKERNKQIIENIIKRLGHKQLVLTDRVKHANYLGDKLAKLGHKNSVITGVTKNRDFYESDIIISTYALAKEGLDIPELDTLHSLMPKGRNTSVMEQAVGRIERNIKGKETPVCFDYVDINIEFCKNKYTERRRLLKRGGAIVL